MANIVKAILNLYFRGRFLDEIRHFLDFREFLGQFANLEVDGRDWRALLGKFKGKKRKNDV